MNGSCRTGNHVRRRGRKNPTAAQAYRAPYRMYSPAMARWTTEDPLGMIDGPNVYGYVKVNPVLSVDTLGMSIVALPDDKQHDNCGSSDFNVPDRYKYNEKVIDFSSCCEKHDNCYGCNGAGENTSKEECDGVFFNCMLGVCDALPAGRIRDDCTLMARLYYVGVDSYGEKAFNNARECCGSE